MKVRRVRARFQIAGEVNGHIPTPGLYRVAVVSLKRKRGGPLVATMNVIPHDEQDHEDIHRDFIMPRPKKESTLEALQRILVGKVVQAVEHNENTGTITLLAGDQRVTFTANGDDMAHLLVTAGRWIDEEI